MRDLDDAMLVEMKRNIENMFKESCYLILLDDLDDHSFQYCIDNIHNTINYLRMKRRDK